MTTRRLSGVASTSSNGAIGPMVEAYDQFKKKHMQQNKEIIHKNSQLSKTNSELERTVTTLRAERLSLKGAYFHLECENSNLRTRLQQVERELSDLKDHQSNLANRSANGWDKEQIELTQRLYYNAFTTLQALGAALPFSSPLSDSNSRSDHPFSSNNATASPPTPTSSTSSPSHDSDRDRNVTLSRRNSGVHSRAPRPSSIIIHQRNPELSHISEAGEPSQRSETSLDQDSDEDEQRIRDRVGDRWRGSLLTGLRDEPSLMASPSMPARPPTPLFQIPNTTSSPPAPLPTLLETEKQSEPSGAAIQSRPAAPSMNSMMRPAPKLKSAPPAARSASANTASFSQQKPARRVSGIIKAPIHEPQPGNLDNPFPEIPPVSTITSSSNTAGGTKKTSIVGRLGSKSSATSIVNAPPIASTSSKPTAISLAEIKDDYWNERRVLSEQSGSTAKEMLAVVGSRRKSSMVSKSSMVEAKGTTATGRRQQSTTRNGMPSSSRALSSSSEDEGAAEAVEQNLVKDRSPSPYQDEEPAEGGEDEEEEVEDAGARIDSSDEEFIPSRSTPVDPLNKKSINRRRTTTRLNSSQQQEGGDEEEERASASKTNMTVNNRPPSASAPSTLQSNSMLTNNNSNNNSIDENEGLGGGRRARKSVNYALPKLNTKMRRPEDYIPVTTATHQPRKSVRPSVGGVASSSNLLRTKSSLTNLRGRASLREISLENQSLSTEVDMEDDEVDRDRRSSMAA